MNIERSVLYLDTRMREAEERINELEKVVVEQAAEIARFQEELKKRQCFQQLARPEAL